MNKAKLDSTLARLTAAIVGGIMIIAPFYAPITVFIASHFEHFDFLRIWKEIFLTFLGLAILVYIFLHLHRMKEYLNDRLIITCFIYGFLLVGLSIYDAVSGRVAGPAIIYGLMINLRLVGFFVLVYLAFKSHQLSQNFAWWKVVMIPAAVVVGFGILQMTILPRDVLSHIGYNESTIVPYQTVDNQDGFARVQSTLRGPNPLGAYLVVIIPLIASFILMKHRRDRVRPLLLFSAASLMVLFGTYSRSAWLGVFIAGLTVLIVRNLKRLVTRRALILGLAAAVSFGAMVLVFRDNYFFQTTVFHTSDKSTSTVSSNTQRANALEAAANDIWEHPLGGGIGSAGPASFRNNISEPRLSENYFLQIGQETGWAGLLLFITLTIMLWKRLYEKRNTILGLALLASLTGIIFVNTLSHAWADDTLAYIWWGLAGIALARQPTDVILQANKQKHDEKTAKARS